MDLHYIITADLHLERLLYGLPVRQEDTWRCVEHILELCQEPGCQGLIIAGDLFHRKHIAPRHHAQLQTILRHLQHNNRRLLAIDGNHDVQKPSWLDTLPNINMDQHCVQLGTLPFHFFAYRSRKELYPLLQPVLAQTRGLVLHGRLQELLPWKQGDHPVEYDFSARELREMGLRRATVFMGDLHTYGDYYDPEGDNWFIYPGSVEMTELSEGQIQSSRFGPSYDTRKKCLRFFPEHPHGQNWERVDLPNRPYLRKVLPAQADQVTPELLAEVDRWVAGHPQGILCLLYPENCEAVLNRLEDWRRQLLVLRAIPMSPRQTTALPEMESADILEFAARELTPEQCQWLRVILTQDNFAEALRQHLQPLFYEDTKNQSASLVPA